VIPRGAWRLLAALAALNVLGYLDRQLLAALAPLLMADLGLSRTQIGLLIGVAFIAVFALSLVVTGALADRVSRSRLVAVGVGVWSIATALTGTASGFASLAAWRAAVGVGEATLPPSALAMLGDAFPPARLGFANGVFYAGVPLGFAGSFALAALLAPTLGWRACFAVVGAVGLATVAFVWRIAEPLRHAGAAKADAAPAGSALARLRDALAAEPTLALLILGGAALAYTSSASQLAITWLVQERGFPFARAAWLSAVFLAIAGLVGNLAIGALTDRARRAGAAARLRAFVAIGAASLLVAAGFYALPAATPLFYACWFAAQAWLLGWYGPLVAAIAELAPPRSRATVIGFCLLVVNLLGVATGAGLTGWLGDRASLTLGLLASVAVGAVGLLLVLLASLRRPAAE
jgi:predicted MFS family arabinose efflux permease